MKPTVTVSIPVYNGEKFILQALKSVVSQTIKVDEIIICDNRSSDQTIENVNKFIKENKDWNIELFINDSNLGYIKNFVKCYERAKSDFLIILHVDDLLKPDAVEKQINFFRNHTHYAIVGGKADRINSNSELILKQRKTEDSFFAKSEFYEFFKETASYIPFSTVMYNLKLIKDIPFFAEESLGPDELYWPVLLGIHPIAILGESIIDIRIHNDQAHIKNAITKFEDNILHLEKKINKAQLESNKERIDKTKRIIKKQNAQISIKIGRDIFKYHSNVRFSHKYFLYGIKQYPKIIFSKFFVKTLAQTVRLLK